MKLIPLCSFIGFAALTTACFRGRHTPASNNPCVAPWPVATASWKRTNDSGVVAVKVIRVDSAGDGRRVVLPKVAVSIYGPHYRVNRGGFTDSVGQVRLRNVPPDTYVVRAVRIGYNTRIDTLVLEGRHGLAGEIHLMFNVMRVGHADGRTLCE